MRSVAHVNPSRPAEDGAGVPLLRTVPPSLPAFDPFLMLDQLGPVRFPAGEAPGFPDHPHRGFETVTYLLDGEMEHRDSRGNAGTLRPGDVQWMSAGRGVIHSEMPSTSFQKTGGRLHGFQLWVNLPRADKLMAPRYQEIPAARIPKARSADGLVEAAVVAGEALGVRAVIDTRVPITFLDLTLQKGGRHAHALPRDHHAFAFVFDGEARVGRQGRKVRAGELATFAGDGDTADVAADVPARLLLLAGAPIGEPIAWHGPFVMNTREELVQAVEDYQSGRFA